MWVMTERIRSDEYKRKIPTGARAHRAIHNAVGLSEVQDWMSALTEASVGSPTDWARMLATSSASDSSG